MHHLEKTHLSPRSVQAIENIFMSFRLIFLIRAWENLKINEWFNV